VCCTRLLYTILHGTNLIIFPLTLHTIVIAPMMSIWGKEKPAMDQCPSLCQISSRLAKRRMRNVSKSLIHLWKFWRSWGFLGWKFTRLGTDVHQCPMHQCAKFRPILTTSVRDICCQSSLISLTAWSTNSKRQVPAYYTATLNWRHLN